MHSCLKRLDQFMFCMSEGSARCFMHLSQMHTEYSLSCFASAVTNQFQNYYQDGTYANCPLLLARWQTCLRTKVMKTHDAKAVLAAEHREEVQGEHKFRFKPVYAQEAWTRYGIEVDLDT